MNRIGVALGKENLALPVTTAPRNQSKQKGLVLLAAVFLPCILK
jgi:hypothetical protein